MYKKTVQFLVLVLILLVVIALILVIIPLAMKTGSYIKINTPTKEESAKTAYTLEFGDASYYKDAEGRSIVVFHYNFINNSDKTLSPLGTIGHCAYQNGMDLKYVGESNLVSYDAAVIETIVEPGKVVRNCQVAYVLNNNTSVLQFEVHDWSDHSQKYIVTYMPKNIFN